MNFRFNKHSKQRGVGMVELLVALVLSSLVSIVVIQLFIQNKDSYRSHENITRMQENGRYALQVITQALRSGDFWGCLPIYQRKATSTPESQYQNVFGIDVNGRVQNVADVDDGVFGEDGVNTAWFGFEDRPDRITISGVYTGRSFPLPPSDVVPTPPPPTGTFQIDVTGIDDTGIEANDLVILSDCNKGVLFQVTNDPDDTFSGTDPKLATIEHSTTPASDPPTNYRNNFDDLGSDLGDWDLNATRLYHGFVGNNEFTVAMDDPDGAGPEAAVPTLMRNNQPMVPGVENLQVVWGVDTSGPPLDGEADTYVNAATVADWERVVSARVSLVVRAPEATNENPVGYTMDGRTVAANALPDEDGVTNGPGRYHSRRVYTTTIAFRNRTP